MSFLLKNRFSQCFPVNLAKFLCLLCIDIAMANILGKILEMRKLQSLFYKINIFLQKITTSIGLQTEQVLSVTI